MAYHNFDYVSTDPQSVKTVVSRTEATQLLVLDSKNRSVSSQPGGPPISQPWNKFRLGRPQALMQSYATRVGVSEVRFPMYIPNITERNNFIFFAGFNAAGGDVNLPVTVPPGFYTPQQLADFLNAAITTALITTGPDVTWNDNTKVFTLTVPDVPNATKTFWYNPLTSVAPPKQQYLTRPSLTSSMGFEYEQVSEILPPQTLPKKLGATTLTTNAMITFLVNGPNIYQTNQYVNWYINSDNSPKWGDLYLTSQPGQPSNLAGTMAYSTSGLNASPQSADYLKARQQAGVKIQVSLGGFYYDMLGSIATTQQASDIMQTIAYVLLGLGDSSWNKLNWNASGLVDSTGARFYFDGINLDLENIGQGGNPSRPAAGGGGNLPAVPLAVSPPVPATGPYPSTYNYMIAVCKTLCTAWGTYGSPSKIFSIAPLSPATTLLTKNTAPTNALGNWQPFPSPTAALSTYNNGTGISQDAQIHPNQLKFFSQVFPQMYNEESEWAPGGANFNSNVTQWAYLVKKAQDLGGSTKMILGFATQDIQLGPPWNNTTYPELVDAALVYANNQLKAFYPTVKISDWCDGIGFWASPSGTTTLKQVYAEAPTRMPNLPVVGNCMVWADADYVLSALDPLWDQLPVPQSPTPPFPPGPVGSTISGNPTGLVYTQYIDIVSEKLNYYSQQKDGSSDPLTSQALVCRLYIADEISIAQNVDSFYQPFLIHRQFSNPKTLMWNKDAVVDWLDIAVYDEYGELVPLPQISQFGSTFTGSYPNFQITLLATEN
jgi:hypothetical protein